MFILSSSSPPSYTFFSLIPYLRAWVTQTYSTRFDFFLLPLFAVRPFVVVDKLVKRWFIYTRLHISLVSLFASSQWQTTMFQLFLVGEKTNIPTIRLSCFSLFTVAHVLHKQENRRIYQRERGKKLVVIMFCAHKCTEFSCSNVFFDGVRAYIHDSAFPLPLCPSLFLFYIETSQLFHSMYATVAARATIVFEKMLFSVDFDGGGMRNWAEDNQ